uniref:Uncharacterized protein n=1 Tax=Meloidogyne enterolobii TaxID=390850 RepID=A0A6V7W7N6_MELEN|nr:unnamed protein product [Meloidogyne enterolobii]
MSLDILDILFKLDYFVCLLIGFPLNIILIILIIFKTPKEMKTHSRILIQNCVLDILMLINQMFVQSYHVFDTEGNAVDILPNGILLSLMDINSNPFIYYVVLTFWQYIATLDLNGLCVQFIYRYLVLNRNMKINFCRYLLMLSIALFVTFLYMLDVVLFVGPYSSGGTKYFSNFNTTLQFIQAKMGASTNLSLFPVALTQTVPYLIIIICGFKMVRYVNLNTNLDGDLKRLNKLLTKVLILLAIVPFVNQAGILFFVIYPTTNNYTTNIIRILIYTSFHFMPVFNPIICILTNTPYRNAVFNRGQIHPQ